MAIVTRYFSTTAAGDESGDSWANRAELDPSGNWSEVLGTTHDFTADSCVAYVGPGTYTFTEALASAVFTNAPTAANPLIFRACDASGNALAIPDPGWTSPEPAWDDSALPVFATTTNIVTASLNFTSFHLIKFTASGRTGGAVMVPTTVGTLNLSWCVVVNSTNNSGTQGISGVCASNCVLTCTGAAYSAISGFTTHIPHSNCRLEGVTGTSGNRRGFDCANNTQNSIENCTVVNCGGDGVVYSGAVTGQSIRIRRCTIANNGGSGFKSNSTGSQTSTFVAEGCMITGNGAFGVDAQSEGNFLLFGNRFRDNTSGNFNGLDNSPNDLNNYTTDSDDSTEYVSTGANGDFRIKNTASNVWGKGFGAGDQEAAGGGTTIAGTPMRRGMV